MRYWFPGNVEIFQKEEGSYSRAEMLVSLVFGVSGLGYVVDRELAGAIGRQAGLEVATIDVWQDPKFQRPDAGVYDSVVCGVRSVAVRGHDEIGSRGWVWEDVFDQLFIHAHAILKENNGGGGGDAGTKTLDGRKSVLGLGSDEE